MGRSSQLMHRHPSLFDSALLNDVDVVILNGLSPNDTDDLSKLRGVANDIVLKTS